MSERQTPLQTYTRAIGDTLEAARQELDATAWHWLVTILVEVAARESGRLSTTQVPCELFGAEGS